MTKKIFITGCAKSGTTLLLRMCYAFKDTFTSYRTGFNGHEMTLPELLNFNSSERFVIGKRLPPFVLSNTETLDFEDQITWIKKHDIGIINVVRDGRDVVLSDGNYVKPQRWIDSINQRKQYADIIDMEVKYEDLIRYPNMIQESMTNVFGIESHSKFSDYPDYVPDWVYDWNVSVTGRAGKQESDYGKRKLSESSINKDIEAYKTLCTSEQLSEFDSLLSELNYK